MGGGGNGGGEVNGGWWEGDHGAGGDKEVEAADVVDVAVGNEDVRDVDCALGAAACARGRFYCR